MLAMHHSPCTQSPATLQQVHACGLLKTAATVQQVLLCSRVLLFLVSSFSGGQRCSSLQCSTAAAPQAAQGLSAAQRCHICRKH